VLLLRDGGHARPEQQRHWRLKVGLDRRAYTRNQHLNLVLHPERHRTAWVRFLGSPRRKIVRQGAARSLLRISGGRPACQVLLCRRELCERIITLFVGNTGHCGVVSQGLHLTRRESDRVSECRQGARRREAAIQHRLPCPVVQWACGVSRRVFPLRQPLSARADARQIIREDEGRADLPVSARHGESERAEQVPSRRGRRGADQGQRPVRVMGIGVDLLVRERRDARHQALHCPQARQRHPECRVVQAQITRLGRVRNGSPEGDVVRRAGPALATRYAGAWHRPEP